MIWRLPTHIWIEGTVYDDLDDSYLHTEVYVSPATVIVLTI